MRVKLVQTVVPASEPVTLQEAKDFARIDTTADDALVTALITAARQHLEMSILHRALITQTWQLLLDAFPTAQVFLDPVPQPIDPPARSVYPALNRIEVPLPPLQSVTSIQYVDVTGATQTMSASDYRVDTKQDPGIIQLAAAKSWPTTPTLTPNAVTITFVAGYGAAAAVPEPIKTALKLLVGDLYENRESSLVGGAFTELPWLERLLASYRVFVA